jgi:transcriptional regulator with XRE-family HTH domain
MVIKKLKQAIVERGMTTAELAKKSRVKKRTLDNWLYGKSPNPEVADFMRAASALGVSMEYLLTGKDGSGLTEEETLLLSLFRETPKQRRALLVRIAGVLKDDPKSG